MTNSLQIKNELSLLLKTESFDTQRVREITLLIGVLARQELRRFGSPTSIAATNVWKFVKTPGVPLTYLFVPEPRAGVSTLRALWPIVLLIRLASLDPEFRPRLTRLTGKSRDQIESAWKSSRTAVTWTPGEWAQCLFNVLELYFPNPVTVTPRLVRNHLVMGTKQVRLAKQQRRFFELCAKSRNHLVNHQTFRTKGIGNPTKLVSDLRKKFEKLDVELDIRTHTKAYEVVVCL